MTFNLVESILLRSANYFFFFFSFAIKLPLFFNGSVPRQTHIHRIQIGKRAIGGITCNERGGECKLTQRINTPSSTKGSPPKRTIPAQKLVFFALTPRFSPCISPFNFYGHHSFFSFYPAILFYLWFLVHSSYPHYSLLWYFLLFKV